jgi:hypothetical protein
MGERHPERRGMPTETTVSMTTRPDVEIETLAAQSRGNKELLAE